MLQTNFERVLEFHEVFGALIGDFDNPQISDNKDLRLSLIREEMQELEEAIAANDIVETADALGDLLYVIYGTLIDSGIDADLLVGEIHASNMSKLGKDGEPILRYDGKVLKGPNYFKPNIKGVLYG